MASASAVSPVTVWHYINIAECLFVIDEDTKRHVFERRTNYPCTFVPTSQTGDVFVLP
jgi:hypothetical protein